MTAIIATIITPIGLATKAPFIAKPTIFITFIKFPPKNLNIFIIPLNNFEVNGNIFFKACISPPNLKCLPNFKNQANDLVSGPVINLFVNPIVKLKIAIAPITFIIPAINFG